MNYSLIKILIAEDEFLNYKLLETRLKKNIFKNCQVERAINGLEAVEKAKEVNYDLILMDIRMPIMDGFEAISRIKQFKPKSKIIVQSANGEKVMIEKAHSLGCIDYLVKPFSCEEFQLTIEKVLRLSVRNK